MKKLLPLALTLLFCFSLSMPVLADDSYFTIENGVLKEYIGPGNIDVTVPSGVTVIGDGSFFNSVYYRKVCPSSVTIPYGVTKIDSYAFYYCLLLYNVTIPESVTSIELSAFSFSGITSVTIPGSVKKVEHAFNSCQNLTTLVLGEGVTEIVEGAFQFDTNLTNVTLPSTLKIIGDYSFHGCESLTDITIPASVTSIGENAFLVHDKRTNSEYPIPGLIIHGTAGSCAETYARAHNIPFVADGGSAQPAATTLPTKFTDVAAGSPFADAINWAVDQGITTGKTATTFAPSENCTTGQILTFLWRANGSPEPTIDNPFTDSISASFQKAAVWAYETGLVSGTTFGASTPCTRAATVEYLWKAAGSPAASENASFSDVPASVDYAQAVAWAVENGITSGTGNGQSFSPDSTCTRGQIVTFLYRAMGQ